MKAELLPLVGKYYGTEIKITNGRGTEYIIELWNCNECIPSDRELQAIGLTRDGWDNNEVLLDEFGGVAPVKELDLFEFSHCETQETYEDALHIVNCINKGDNIG